MTLISNMQIELRPGLRDAAVEAFKQRKVFEECCEAIPGFLAARLLEVQDQPGSLSVMAEWTDRAAFEEWMQHPARAAQEADLGHFLAAAPETVLYSSASHFERSR